MVITKRYTTSMADKIFLEGLEARCIIGTLPRERKIKQKLVLDLAFPAAVRKAAERDNLKDAINYKKIADRATAFVCQSHFYLIETLAERLAAALLEEFPLNRLALTIRKPGALKNAQNVGVHLERKRAARRR